MQANDIAAYFAKIAEPILHNVTVRIDKEVEPHQRSYAIENALDQVIDILRHGTRFRRESGQFRLDCTRIKLLVARRIIETLRTTTAIVERRAVAPGTLAAISPKLRVLADEGLACVTRGLHRGYWYLHQWLCD